MRYRATRKLLDRSANATAIAMMSSAATRAVNPAPRPMTTRTAYCLFIGGQYSPEDVACQCEFTGDRTHLRGNESRTYTQWSNADRRRQVNDPLAGLGNPREGMWTGVSIGRGFPVPDRHRTGNRPQRCVQAPPQTLNVDLRSAASHFKDCCPA